MNEKSFLASLARTQAPSRPSERIRYDEALDELVVQRDGVWVPAVDTDEPPMTKKADIEKGEDQKDRWS